ncbi:response regulator [Sorangium sp. So ce385]|uniref:response regulator n=1 Tax=Sorangium sp. So ce385 TaxID=3133308 RepID=UPI003F5C05AF
MEDQVANERGGAPVEPGGRGMSFKDFDALLVREGALPSPETAARPKVLVVDDDPTIRKSLRGVLDAWYDVTVCASAKEGRDAVEDDTCAVVLDVKMGKHDGFWACDEIRRKHPDVPVIFYSAYQDAKDPYDIINHHRPFGYITKSGDIACLLGAIRTAVDFYGKVLEGRRLIEQHRKVRTGG